MVISAKKESLEFYTDFLWKGGYIEVGTLNNKWIRIKDQAMLERFYEANCLFRIPLRKLRILIRLEAYNYMLFNIFM